MKQSHKFHCLCCLIFIFLATIYLFTIKENLLNADDVKEINYYNPKEIKKNTDINISNKHLLNDSIICDVDAPTDECKELINRGWPECKHLCNLNNDCDIWKYVGNDEKNDKGSCYLYNYPDFKLN